MQVIVRAGVPLDADEFRSLVCCAMSPLDQARAVGLGIAEALASIAETAEVEREPLPSGAAVVLVEQHMVNGSLTGMAVWNSGDSIAHYGWFFRAVKAGVLAALDSLEANPGPLPAEDEGGDDEDLDDDDDNDEDDEDDEDDNDEDDNDEDDDNDEED